MISAVLMLMIVLVGCGGLSESDVSYAGPMVDNVIGGLADRDYDMFSRDFSDTLKSALTEENFDTFADLLDEKIGSYESKNFGGASPTTQDDVDMTVVVYKAKFSKETSNVLITVKFSGESGDETIEGIYFNSPNLQKQ